MSAPFAHAREPHQMRAITRWILSREVRRNGTPAWRPLTHYLEWAKTGLEQVFGLI
jgi:hypothetical protein